MIVLPPVISELINRFEQNHQAYHFDPYNETQLRREFVDPFFETLGWDVNNKQGYAEAYKDVIHEDAIKVGGVTKAPDYCFRIGGTRKFFIEAKKPLIKIKEDIGAAFQLRRYAWSAKLPLSILTNFEEFAVYDCRIKPDKADKASTARILYLTEKDYARHWEEIVSVFSHEAVLKGSFDKYAEAGKGKKGTAEVDTAFLKEIEFWRELLARNLALRNPELTQRELNFSVQRIIDRIIFLRICEDRGIEDYNRLLSLINGTNVYRRLDHFFRLADEHYNSGLFHFSLEKGRNEEPDRLTPHLIIDDLPLKQIIKDLYYPDSPYEFSVLPADILGQVYEQFLGKVIRLTAGHRAVVEDKPEVKKAGGVYYTPTYIVDYIVKNTVRKLITGKTPNQAAKIRILDPACGSGSFLINAYQYLLDWHLDWYQKNTPRKWTTGRSPVLCQGHRGEWKLTTAERKRILLNNIYGVDIDSQAVEVTKLSLLLKVLEGENEQTLSRQLKLFRERALPDLGNNIKCGNSLIGPDYSHGQQLSILNEDEVYRINAFDWKNEFPEAMESGGFNAVIGNPPYGAEFQNITTDYLKNKFHTFVWRGESYLVFVEEGINLLKLKGLLGYIVPDTYLNLGFTKSLRTFLLQNSKVCEIVALPSNIFSSGTVDTTLLFTEKTAQIATFQDTTVLVKLFNKKSSIQSVKNPNREFKISTKLWVEQDAFNIHSEGSESKIISRIERQNMPLSNIAELFYGIKAYQVGKGNPPQTKNILETKPFTSPTKKDKTFFPLFDGKHAGRYQLLWKNNNWIKYGPWLAEPRQPQKYEGEKLLIRKIVSQTLISTYFSETSYCNTLLFVLKIKGGIKLSYYYILGILNSKFIGWYFRKRFQISPDDTFPQIMIRDILQFPIPNFDNTNHAKMAALIEKMLSLHKQLAEAKTDQEKIVLQRQIDTTDHQIDQLVYDLYGLTEEEIKIVEET